MEESNELNEINELNEMNEVYERDVGSYVTTENMELSEGSELMVLRFRPTIRVVPQIYRK